MKKIFLFVLLPFYLFSQPYFNIRVEQIDFPGLPSVQSFVLGTTEDGNWVILGGRIDGLHIRMPFAAFDPAFNNTNIFVIDPIRKRVWEKSIGGLPAGLIEQLQSSNMEFFQDEDRLILIGGYGYGVTKSQFLTHPYLTVVDLELLANSVINNENLVPAFQQIEDARMAVTGGQLQKSDDYFYLVGGQKFEGRYNPMGPNHGPGFTQEYTNEIRKFRLQSNGLEYQISDFEAIHDETNLHRRDYNLVPQIFPDGDFGFTAFSGVFQHNADLPFLNSVDIKPGNYEVNNDFSQLLNQYHTAHAAIFDASNNQMHTLFFGGIGQYYKNATGSLINDTDVPFVKTISLITRHADGKMEENSLPVQMPGYLGASAEFIPNPDLQFLQNGILKMENFNPTNERLGGYTFGGIESSQANVFFSNGDNLSWASGKLFAVYISRAATSPAYSPTPDANTLTFKVFPNPADTGIVIEYKNTEKGKIWMMLQNENGKIVKTWHADQSDSGTYQVQLDLQPFSAGNYLISISNGKHLRTEKITLHK